MNLLSRRGLIILCGIFVFLTPWIGIPLSGKYVFLHVLGLAIIILAWARRASDSAPASASTPAHPAEPTFVDNAAHFPYR